MNIAIVHDWLSEFAGADKVLFQLKQIYPNADIFTSIYDERKVPQFEKYKVYTTYLQKFPLSKKLRSTMVPLMPLAFEQLDLSKYDLVISNSTSAGKGVITRPNTCHISYCHTPTRYLWMPEMDERASTSWLRRRVNKTLKVWDLAASARPDYYIGNSINVKDRIKKFYNRDAEVVYPPTDTSFYNSKEGEVKKAGFYLFVGRFVPYKKADLVVEAFNKLEFELRLIGTGHEEEKLKSIAKDNIKFLGRASDEVLFENLKSASAVIFPSEEDFGIVPVEAMACGTPVIAYGVGGAKETVVEGITGEFFTPQTPEALINVIKKFDPKKYKFENLRSRAEEFSNEIFRKNFASTVEKMYSQYQKDLNT
ncbi:MAG: glycosyltransferase [Candidatus Berkelbacteria bacterium]|nr:glycosyltransferase [Candidatus Berkelbacteria bacterium]